MVVDRRICFVDSAGRGGPPPVGSIDHAVPFRSSVFTRGAAWDFPVVICRWAMFGVGRAQLWFFFSFVVAEGSQVVAVFVNDPARR